MNTSSLNTSHCGEEYKDGKVNLQQEITEPSYGEILKWMRYTAHRSVPFDFWARGNYTRRIIFQRNQGIKPLLVQVSYVDEIRWAHRRLALLGMPAEFVFCGDLTEEQKILYCDRYDGLWDAGWGYLATIWKKKSHYYAALMGYARLMPESVLDWLVDEAAEDFIQGKVFVSPAELIGINAEKISDSFGMLSTVTNGFPFSNSYEIAKAFLQLELPYLDKMSPSSFNIFLRDYEGEIVRFQNAFKKLVTVCTKSEAQITDHLEELKQEIAELTKSDKYKNTRKGLSRLGGTLETFAVSFAIGAYCDPHNFVGAVGAATMGAAAKSLFDLYTQTSKVDANLSDNPYFILWKLGMSRPSQVRRFSRIKVKNIPEILTQDALLNRTYHWLCPPTPGVGLLVVKKDS